MNVGEIGLIIYYLYTKHTYRDLLLRQVPIIFGGDMEDNTKLVDFDVYCPKCKYLELDDSDDPCNECLAYGGNYNSHKPVNYEEKKR